MLDPNEAEYTKPKSDWDAVEVPQEANLTVKKIRDVLKSILTSDACYQHVFAPKDRPKKILKVLDSHFQNTEMPYCNRMWAYVLHLWCNKYGQNGDLIHEKFPTTPRFEAKPIESPMSPPRDPSELLGAAGPSQQPETEEVEEEPVKPRKKKQKTEMPKQERFVVTLESRFAMGTNPDKATLKQILTNFKSIQISGPNGLRITTANMIEPPPERLARGISLSHVRYLKGNYITEAHQGLDHHFYCNLVLAETEVQNLLKGNQNKMDKVFQYLRTQLADGGPQAKTDPKYKLEAIGGNHSRQAKQELQLEFPGDDHLNWWASR